MLLLGSRFIFCAYLGKNFFLKTKRMPTLYALVCGVDQYRQPVPALHGCVNDATMVADYLRKNVNQRKLRLELVTLFDEQATRQNIIDQFGRHLGKARAGDTALFFFAGHGGQEMAHEYFAPYEPDMLLETILCYDSRHNGVRDIADKELRYLLHKLSGPDPSQAPHIVVIQDNCHSGGAVRGEKAEVEVEFVARNVKTEAQPRPWEEFVFAQALPLSRDAKNQQPDELLPVGRLVQIAACQSNEFAWETTHARPDGTTFKGGIFTRRMLEALQQYQGNLSYYDLQSKIRGRIGGSTNATQTPNIYVSTNPSDAFRSFLYGEGSERPTYCNVQWNKELGWHMDIGAFHNVPSDPRVMPAEVLVRENMNSPKTYKAITTAVEAGRSRLVFEGEAPPQDLLLVGEVQNLHREKLRVFFDATARQTRHIDTLVQKAAPNVKALLGLLTAVATEAEAQYVLRADAKAFYITFPNDARPLAFQQGPVNEPAALRAIEQLAHISRWETARQIFNPATRLRPLPPLLLECFNYQGSNPQPVQVPIQDGVLHLSAQQPNVQLRLVNLCNRVLFAGALQMDSPFSISPAPIDGYVARLEAGQAVYLTFGTGNPLITLGVPNFIRQFGWPTYDFYLKILISTHMFDITTLQLPGLPPPVKEGARGDDWYPEDNARGFSGGSEMPDWAAYTIRVSVKL